VLPLIALYRLGLAILGWPRPSRDARPYRIFAGHKKAPANRGFWFET